MRRKLSTRENEGVTGVDAGVELAYRFVGYGNGLVRVLAEGDRIDIVDSEAAADESGSAVFQQRKVQIGPTDKGLRVIESGLKPEDRVVTAGLLRVIPGQKIDPQVTKIDQSQASAK